MLTENAYAPALLQPTHTHDVTALTLVLRGSLTETVGAKRYEARPGDLVVKPRNTPHEDRFGPHGAATMTIRIADDYELGGYRWLFGGEAIALMLSLRHGNDGFGDLIASLDPPRRDVVSPRMRSVAEVVATSDAAICAIASDVAMHPVALARAFRRAYGCSMLAYRQRARVRRALELMTSTSRPLVDVALETGFADQSHFSRVFKLVTGTTPRAYRFTARGPAVPARARL